MPELVFDTRHRLTATPRHDPRFISVTSDNSNSPSVPLLQTLEQLQESVIVTDAEIDAPGPRIVYANAAFSRMTGYDRAEVYGRSPRILQGPDSDRQTLDRLRLCLKAGKRFEGETFNYRKDGTPFVMRWYIEPILDAEGQIRNFFGIQRDVTAELEASHQQRALEQAIGQLADSLVLFGRDGRVRYCNDAYLRWCDRPAHFVIGALIWSLPGFPPTRRDLSWARRLLSRGQGWQREYEAQGGYEEAERCLLSVTVSPIRDPEGQIVEYVAVSRDVTQLRRLKSIAEAHNFHENLGSVFSGIRHELGNPVNSIKTALQVVTDSFETLPRANLRHYLDGMSEEVGRVEYLLRSLRSYSLYDHPQLEIIDIKAFLSRFRLLIQGGLERQGVRVVVKFDEQADTVWADPQALHQVLLNLINNATAALENRDERRIEILAGHRGDHGSLSVRDNGSGIPGGLLAHVFKPFYTTRRGGTGLGLAISRHLLSQMRGSIELESSAAGTEARILLDRHDPRNGQKPAEQSLW